MYFIMGKVFDLIFIFLFSRLSYIGYVYMVNHQHRGIGVAPYSVYRTFSVWQIHFYFCVYLVYIKKSNDIRIYDSKKNSVLVFLYSFFRGIV